MNTRYGAGDRTATRLRLPRISSTKPIALRLRLALLGCHLSNLRFSSAGIKGVSLILAYTTQFDTMQRKTAERCIR